MISHSQAPKYSIRAREAEAQGMEEGSHADDDDQSARDTRGGWTSVGQHGGTKSQRAAQDMLGEVRSEWPGQCLQNHSLSLLISIPINKLQVEGEKLLQVISREALRADQRWEGLHQ